MEKYVLVTGAYGGLGRAVIQKLLENDYYVIATDLHIDQSMQHSHLLSISMNICDDQDIEKVYHIVLEHTNSLYAIINLAGIFYLDSLVEGDEQKLRKIIDTNFFGTYKVNKMFQSLLVSGISRIVNVTSELAIYSPQPFMGYYTISKGMLDIYCDVLRRELNYLNIKVVKIHSGSFKTKLLSNASDEYDRLIKKTKHYKNQLAKLKFMMDKELKKDNNPTKFANLMLKILKKKKPKICYKINRSLSLRFLSILPETWQDKIYLKFIK